MTKEETFFELYDLFENRLNQLGHIQAKEVWDICKSKTQKSYNTFYVVFTSVMETMIEQGKAEIVIGDRGVYNILKPNRKPTTFVKHIVGPYEGHMQFCLICGEVICDYRRAVWPSDQSPPSGFAEGELYIQGKNPTSYFPGPFNEKWLSDGDVVVDCNKK